MKKKKITNPSFLHFTPFILLTRYSWTRTVVTMVELDDRQRMGLLVAAAAILIFTILNMTGILFSDEKLYLLDLVGIHLGASEDAIRTNTDMSIQDIVGFLAAAAMGVLYFITAEEELDWEALLGDEEEE